jgi:hypothetical protein
MGRQLLVLKLLWIWHCASQRAARCRRCTCRNMIGAAGAAALVRAVPSPPLRGGSAQQQRQRGPCGPGGPGRGLWLRLEWNQIPVGSLTPLVPAAGCLLVFIRVHAGRFLQDSTVRTGSSCRGPLQMEGFNAFLLEERRSRGLVVDVPKQRPIAFRGHQETLEFAGDAAFR